MATGVRRVFSSFPPSAFLLAAQLLFLVLYAVFDDVHGEHAVISFFGVVVLALRVWVVERSPARNWIAWVIAIPTFFLSLLSARIGDPSLLVWSSVFEAALYFYVAGSLIATMMEDYEVTTDELYGVGATFTLLAWGYAYLSLILQTLYPGSFLSQVRTEGEITFTEYLLLSFTNLSSTGLSDILPATNWARVLLMLEQFTGVGYIAMVVSRMVGLTLQRQTQRKP